MNQRGAVVGLFVIIASCGGKAIIDPPLDGDGGDGAGANSSGGDVGVGASGAAGAMGGFGGATTTSSMACDAPPSDGMVFGCSGAVNASSGGGVFCESYACDDGGNTYTSACSDGSCTCLYNDSFICECELPGGTTCGFGESCCPMPFP